MQTLGGLDASFLYLETPEMPMHVGSFCLYELPAEFKGNWHRTVQAHIARRIHLAAIFSRKLRFMPLDLGHPAWIQADQVDLDFHIRPIKGRTLTVSQAEAMCAQLHSQLMDRRQPLWEFYVFERIRRANGSLCAGLYSKIHHAALDGQGATVLTHAIMDISASPRDVPAPGKARKNGVQHAPTPAQMAGTVWSNSLAQYARLIKALPHAARVLGGTVIKRSFIGSGIKTRPTSPLHLAPMTDFNVAVTTQRTFGTARVSFAHCIAMAKAVDGSFNDIVLWICATALRSYLSRYGGIPAKSLLAAMPISLREEGNQDFNTQASMTVVELGTQFADPMQRLQAIMRSTAKVKNARTELKGLIPTDFPSLFAPWIVGGVAKAGFKAYRAMGLSHRLPMLANLVISNVPGPPVPLYLAGAKMLTFHPMSIVVHGVALNITLQSYAGEVYFGLIADKEAVPHMHDLTAALSQAFEAGRRLLVKAPGSGTPSARHKTANTRRKPAKKVTPATQTKRLATDAHAKVKRDATKNAGVRPSATVVTKASRT